MARVMAIVAAAILLINAGCVNIKVSGDLNYRALKAELIAGTNGVHTVNIENLQEGSDTDVTPKVSYK